MDAVNKEQRDIKVCSSRAAERQLKGMEGGGGEVGRWDLIIPPTLTPALYDARWGSANRWRCYCSAARKGGGVRRPGRVSNNRSLRR